MPQGSVVDRGLAQDAMACLAHDQTSRTDNDRDPWLDRCDLWNRDFSRELQVLCASFGRRI